jgi:hypothetical protein
MLKPLLTTIIIASSAFAGTMNIPFTMMGMGMSDGFYVDEYKAFDVAGKTVTNYTVTLVSCDGTHNSISTTCEDWDTEFFIGDWTYGNPVTQYAVYVRGYVTSPEYKYASHNYASVLLNIEVEYELNTIFDAVDKSINLNFENTIWADIHYKINNGGQLNYRMTKSGDKFKQIIFQAIQNGDVVEYYTTSMNSQSQVTSSPWQSFTVSGLVDLLTPSVTSGIINVTSTENLDWIDVHYTINGSSQYNYRMSGAQKEFSFPIPQQLEADDVISYWFTYSLNGQGNTTTPNSFTQP